MAQLLDEIQWGEPILARADDSAWEAEIKRRGGTVSEADRRVAPNPWLRELCLRFAIFRPSELPMRLFNIAALVTAQENACRYCYGANRAFMKILGYPESFINRIERDMHLAELDARERGLIGFCRNLARSRPRPAKADMEALLALGFTPRAVGEMSMLIAMCCFYNRVGILTACPPEFGFENMANGMLGRIVGLAGPIMRRLAARRPSEASAEALDAVTLASGAFGTILTTLAGVPGAGMMKNALDGAFASKVLSLPAKALMFAVVARTLGCRHSESAARKLLASADFGVAEIDSALSTLESKRLAANESRLLAWSRDTVHYQTAAIQDQTRTLAAAIGDAAVLEAIGVAALANATVRLAMLLE